MSIMQFSQNLMQRGDVNKDPYQQLPYFETQHCTALRSILPKTATFYQYCMMDPEERRKAFNLVFKDDAELEKKWNHQELCIESLPLV